MLHTTIKGGLPCIAVVTYYHHQAGNAWADNPDDYNGYTELEFELRTLRGKPADWLEKAATDKDRERIERELLELQS